MWRAAGIDGCRSGTDREPAEQEQVALTVASLDEFGHLRGVVRTPFGGSAVCGCYVTRLADEDWLAFYLPLGSLARIERRIGGFPFGRDGGVAALAWREPLDAWLAEVAHEVFVDVGFRFGLIGFEPEPEISEHVPDQRWNGYLVPDDEGLTHLPANR